jgi:hypothetical protein
MGSFAANMQAVTYLVGKKIAPFGSEKELPRGFQDAITPKFQDNFNTIIFVLYLIIFVLGSIKLWYIGLPLVLVILILKGFLRKLWPNNINFYLKMLIQNMANRMADYAKNGDPMRSDAAKEMLENLENLYVMIRDENLKIPSFEEIKRMPVGE